MDINQIAALKADLINQYDYKMNELREERERVIASLSQAEKTILGISTGFKKTPVTERMIDALKKMRGDFTRQELFDSIRMDHTGVNSPDGTLSVSFTQLVASKDIVVTYESRGNRPGRYKWAGREDRPLSESSREGGLMS